PSPEALIFSHFPEEQKWLLVEEPVEILKWQHWPKVETSLFDLGVLPAKVRGKVGLQGFRGFVRAESSAGPQVYLHDAPLEGHLRAGQSYTFRIESIGFDEMSVFNGGKFHDLKRNGKVFEGNITVANGLLTVSAKTASKDKLFRPLLTYEVE
ncbi:MAG: hypothetical protein AB7K24_33520, partial [Gemmataceae bacterium]